MGGRRSGPGPATWPGSTGWRIWAGVCSGQPLSWVRAWPHDVAGFDGVEDLGGRPFKAALVMVPGLEPRRVGKQGLSGRHLNISGASRKSPTTRRLQNGTSLSCFRVWNHDVHGRNRMHLTCGWSLGSADMSWAFVFTLARHGSGPGSVTKSGSLESALSSWVALALGHCHWGRPGAILFRGNAGTILVW